MKRKLSILAILALLGTYIPEAYSMQSRGTSLLAQSGLLSRGLIKAAPANPGFVKPSFKPPLATPKLKPKTFNNPGSRAFSTNSAFGAKQLLQNAGKLVKPLAMTGAAIGVSALTNSPAHCYAYGALLMQNPETGKLIILLPDCHVKIEAISAQEQQQEIIDLIKVLQSRGHSVHVLVEDVTRYKFIKLILLLTKDTYSPMFLLTDLCKALDIPCTDIECRSIFRTLSDSIRISIIQYEADPETLKKLKSYHGSDIYRAVALDANCLNQLKKSNADVEVIFTGGAHTGSISKILYQQGYTQTYSIIPENLDSIFKSHLTDFHKDEAIQFPTRIEHVHLPDIKGSVLSGMETSGIKKSLEIIEIRRIRDCIGEMTLLLKEKRLAILELNKCHNIFGNKNSKIKVPENRIPDSFNDAFKDIVRNMNRSNKLDTK